MCTFVPMAQCAASDEDADLDDEDDVTTISDWSMIDDEDDLGACQTEIDSETDPKRYTRKAKKGWYAKVKFNELETFHFVNPATGDVCCHRRTLVKMVFQYMKKHRLLKAARKDETWKACRQLYKASDSQLGQLNRRRLFVFFCIFVRSEPTVEQLYEMGMDNVCPAVVDQLELDSDEQLVDFVANTWYIPRPTKEERVALKAANKEKRKARKLRRRRKRPKKLNPDF